MIDKPYKGRITDWCKLPSRFGIGYFIYGRFLEHPDFGEKETNTSWVEKHDPITGEIETRNSRYTLIGPEIITQFRIIPNCP